MKHFQFLKSLSAFRCRSEINLVTVLEDGTRQLPTIDISQPITPARCVELLEKAEARSGIELDRLVVWVAVWEFDDKEDFLEYSKKGCADELSPTKRINDVYEFTKSDSYLELTRTIGADIYPHAWMKGGFKRVDYFGKPISETVDPIATYKEFESAV